MAAMIAERIQGQRANQPKLRLVKREDFEGPVSDQITRDCRIRRIRWISKTYGLKWLVDQHVFGLAGIDCLEDGDLLDLHKEMEQGAECCREGIPLEDVGLIRTQVL